ncbi:MAG: hypothetical protein ACOYVF_06520 [Candidatus Zixiibacteriota bacterium]
MKKIIISVIVTILTLSASSFAIPAVGSGFGCLTTAQSHAQGTGDLGFAIGLGDNATTFIGSLKYGLSTYTDGRIKVGMYDPDYGDAGFMIGGDFLYQMFSVRENPNRPFDMAPGGFFEYIDFEGGSVFELGAQIIGSYDFEMTGGSILSPYARFNMRMESISADGGGSESELKFGINGGVCFQVSELIKLYGEFQFDGNDGVFFGLDYNVL